MTTSVTIKNNGPHIVFIESVEHVNIDDRAGEIMGIIHEVHPHSEAVLYLWQNHSLKIKEGGLPSVDEDGA